MSRLILGGVLILVLLASGADQVWAENTLLIRAFGGDPGSPLAHAYDYGIPRDEGPTYTVRIPVFDADIAKVFYDTVLTVTIPDKIVHRVTAARAYRTLMRCNEARATVVEKLAKGLPRGAVAGTDDWQGQSSDGDVIGRIVCRHRRHDPMPVLALTIERRR